MPRLAPHLILAAFVVFSTATAASGAAGGDDEASAPEASSTEQPDRTRSRADEKYAEALALIAEAEQIDERSAKVEDPLERHGVDRGARDRYRKAVRYLRFTAREQPDHFKAHSDMGYVLRRLGDYPKALDAYARALEIKPDYWRAVEYRGEAYLRLGRIDDAKGAYMTLFGEDRKLADLLVTKMASWVEARREDPGEMSPEKIEAFGSWVSDRSEIAGQTASFDPGAGEGEGQSW